MRNVVVNRGQSIWDIALQEYGSVEAVDTIIEDNNIELCDYIAPGTILKIQDEIYDQNLYDFYLNSNIKPSSEVEDLQGIGNWAIEINFIIS